MEVVAVTVMVVVAASGDKIMLLLIVGGNDLRWSLIPRRDPGWREPPLSPWLIYCNAVRAISLRRMKTPSVVSNV